MKQQLRSLWRTACSAALGLTLAAASVFAQTSVNPSKTPSAPKNTSSKPEAISTQQANTILQNSKVEFVENKGQVVDDKGTVRKDIKFTASSNNTKLYLFSDKLSYVFTKVEGVKHASHPMDMDYSSAKTSIYRMDMELVGANADAAIAPTAMLSGVSNFYTSSAQEGISGVRSFGKLTYENVYPNIDMVLVSKGKGLKAEFIVRPGGDPSLIKMKFNGADNVSLMGDGGLKVSSPLGTITEDTPYSFIKADGKEQEVNVTFNVEGNTVSFNVPDYDKSQTLVIDPQRDWASLSGGTNVDIATAVAVQQYGSGAFATLTTGPAYYIVGHTTSTNYPTTGGAFQTAISGTRNAFVSGFTYGAVGGTTARTFSTYFGANDTQAFGVAVDNAGNIWVVGETTANTGFATGSAFDNSFNSSSNTIPDGFIATFTSAGARTACSYFGGNANDRLQCICIDQNNIVTVGGYTASSSLQTSYGTPTTVWMPNRNGIAARHGLLARFPAGTALTSNPTWLTYYGQAGLTQFRKLTPVVASGSPNGAVWAVGSTTSADSIATAGSFNTAWNNNGSGTTGNFSNDDGFAARFNSGGQLDGATYVGGTNNDGVYGVTNDWTVVNGTVFAICGRTNSENTANIMATAGAISANLNTGTLSANNDGLLWSLQWNGTSPGGSISRQYGTYWGEDSDDYLNDIAMDSNVTVTAVAPNSISAGNGFKYIVVGTTDDPAFAAPYNMMPGFAAGSGAYDAAYSRLRNNGTNFVEELTAFFGGTGNDDGLGLALDAMRNSAIAGSTIGDAAPADLGTGGAPQTGNANTAVHDAFIFKMCDLVVPNQPLISNVSTNGVGSTTGINVCIDTNATATGSASTGAGSGSPACLSDARNQVFIKITNAVAGVTYWVKNITSGTTVTSVLATADQHLVIDISPFLSNAAIFPGMAPNTSQTYNLRIDASTPTSNGTIGGNCYENGAATSPITIFQLPNNSISQTTPAANAPANLGPAPFSNQNFFGCTTGNNVYQVTNNAGHNYSWCVYPSGLTSSVAGNTTNVLTVDFVDVAVATTCTLRVRETNTVSGCAKEYVAFVRLLPIASLVQGGSNGATGVTYNSGLSASKPVNSTFFCSSETGRFDNSSSYTATSYTVPTEVLSTFWWTNSAPVGMAAPTFSASTVAPGTNASGSTNVTWNGPYNANPATTTLTLNSRNTSVGIGPTCDRTNVNLAVQIFPQPVITSVVQSTPASPTNVCETTGMTFTVTVTYPGGAPFASQPITYNAIINRVSLSGGTASPITGSATTTAGGTFTINVANVGTVTTAYDNFGQLNLGVTVTNAATNAPANCTSALVNSAEVNNVTQPPDQKAQDLTILTTTPVTGGTAPFNTILSSLPNALPLDHSQACVYTANPNGVQQEYTYQVVSPNNGTVNPGGDYYDWTVSGTLGVDYTIQAGGDGIASTSIVLRWLTAGSRTINVQQQNDQDPATGGGPYANSCNISHTTFNVTVNNIPAAPTMTWVANAVCENATATLNITGGPANGRVQVYGIQLGAALNVTTYANAAYPASAPFSTTYINLNASGAGTFTFPTGSITPSGAPSNQALQLVMAVASDVNSQCARTNVLSPTLTVWDTPVPVVLTPNVPLAGDNPTPVCPNMTVGPQANVIIPPAVAAAPYAYSVSNLASYPAGTTFAWSLRDNADATNFTVNTDYTISLSSSGGYTNNLATVTFGANLDAAAQPIHWRVIATIPVGCVSPATPPAQDVTILNTPNPDITSATGTAVPPGPYCSNTTSTFSVVTDNSGGGNTYLWSLADLGGTVIVNGNTVLDPTIVTSVTGGTTATTFAVTWTPFSNASNHTYRLRVIETDGLTGCQQADTQFVMVRPTPVATITKIAPPGGPCVFNSENSHIVTYAVPNSTFYTITDVQWTPLGGAVYSFGSSPGNTHDTVRVQWYNAGPTTLTAVVTTADNCTNTGVLNTLVFPVPAPNIIGPASICQNATGTYNVNPVVTNDTYVWDITPSTGGTFVGASSGVGVVSVNVNWNGPANTSYTLRCTQISAAGCTARVPYVVTVNPNPAPSISGPSAICAGQNYTFTTQNNAPVSSYAWSFTANTAGATFVSGQNTATATITAATTGSITLRVDETVVATSCTGFGTKVVSVQTAPAPTIGRTDTNPIGIACVGQTLNYNVTPAVGGRTYAWSVTGGGTIQGASNLNNVNILWNTVGSQTITLTETINSTSCFTTVTQAVNVVNVPAPNISGPTTACGGGATPLQTYTYSTTFNAGNTYNWAAITNGTIVSGQGTNSITVTFNGTAGNRTISVTETNPSNCATTANYTVAVTTRPNPVIQPASPAAICQNSSASYNVTASRIAGSTLNWTVTGGTITTGQGTDIINVLWGTSGTGTISISETNGICTATNATPYSVVINPAPTAFNVGTTTPNICVNGGPVTITLSGSQTSTNYQLVRNSSNLGSPVAGTGSSLTFTDAGPFASATTNTYTVVATNTSTTCTATMTGSATVTVNPLPTPSISGNAAVCAGSTQTYSTANNANRTYSWTVPSGWTITNGQGTSTIIVTVGTTSGSVSVIETNTATTCSATATLAVTVTAQPTVFNVTPANAQVCIGATFNVQLSGSQTGVNYQLFNGTNAVGSPVAGTNAALTFPVVTGTGSGQLGLGSYTFTVRATATSGACNTSTVTMNGSANLTVNPNPTPNVGGPNSVCSNTNQTYSTTNNAGSNYVWTVPAGWTVNSGAGTSTINVTVGASGGNVTVQETIQGTGCTASNTLAVTVSATPTPTVAGPTTICAGTSGTYSTSSTGTYNWNVVGAGGSITSGQGTNTIVVLWGNSPGTGTVSVTVTNGTCVGTGSSTVTVTAQPTAFNVGPATQTICNSTPNATITLSGSQSGVTYELRENGASIGVTQSGTGAGLTFNRTVPPALRSTLPATVSYTIVATGTGGCTNNMTGSAQVNIIANPTPSIGGAATACINSSTTYTVTPVNSGSTYQWTVTGSGNTVASTTANQATINWGTTTGSPFTVSVIETATGGCTGTASTTVTINPLPTAQTVTLAPTTICATGGTGGTTSATVGLANTQTGFTYELILSGNVVRTLTGTGAAANFAPAISNMAAGAYTYSVRAISNTTPACTTVAMSNTVTLTVVNNPAPAITGPNTPCQNATVTYQTTNNNGNTYLWELLPNTAGTIVGPNNTYQANVTWTQTGAASIRVTETNGNGCANQNTYNVTVTTAPTPTISASTASPLCGGAQVTYSTAAISGATYAWTVGNGGTIASGLGTNSIVVNWANATPDVAYTSTVNLTVNAGGCSGSATSNITVNPKANPNITGDAARCSGQQGTYTTSFVVPGRNYAWTLLNAPAGSVITANNSASYTALNANSITVNWVNTGSAPVVATVQVVETPAVGSCTGTHTFNVTVNPLPSMTISGPTQVCQNSTATYTATPPTNGMSYAWNVTNGTVQSGQGTSQLTVNWGTTNGTVSLNVTNNNTGCSAAATNSPVSVTITPNPQPVIAVPPGTISCANSTVTYNVANPSGSFTYTWNVTGAISPTTTQTGTSVTVQWGQAGSGTVTLTATTNGGPQCSGSVTRNVTIDANPTPSISGQTAVCPNQDITYATPFVSGHSYSWSLPSGTFVVTGGSLLGNTVTVRWNNVATPTSRTVSVTETSPNNCSTTATVTVTVNPAPTPIVSGNTNVCAYIGSYDGITINNTQTYTVTNPVNSGSTFQWSIVGGTGGVFTSATSGVGVTSVTVQWDEPTTASTITRVLRVVETTNATPNCSGQTDVNVQINWNAKPVISGPRAWCDNTPYVANSTNASQSGLATYTVNVPTTPPLTGGQTRSYNWTITPSGAGNIVSGQGTSQIQVSWLNATNTPANAVLSLTETISYPGPGLTPTTQFCPQTDTFRVVINPIPKPVITSNDGGITGPNGIGPCGRYANTYTTPADANSTYGWVVSGGSIITGANTNTITVLWNDVATTTAGYVEVSQRFNTPATQCSTTVRQNLNINVTPTPVITGPTVLCQTTTNGTNIGIYTVITKLVGRSYSWNLVNAPAGSSFTVLNLPLGDSIQVTWGGNSTSPIIAGVRLLETSNASGCQDDTVLTVTLNPNPTPVITSTTNGLNPNGVCAGSTHTYATTLVAGNSYLWTVTGGSINGSNTGNSISVTWGNAGPGTITVVEKVGPMTGNGCYTTVTANVTIRPLPLPDLTDQTGGFNRTQVCELSTTQYRTVDNTANGNTYNWVVTGGTISGGQGTPQISVTWGVAGNGTVTLTETTPPSQGGCSKTVSINVTINPLPNPVISGPPTPPVCVNSVQTYSTPSVAGHTYLWSVTGGIIQGVNNNNSVSIRWTSVGTGTVTVTQTNSATNCSKTVSRNIPVNALPVVTITPSGPTTLCDGGTITLAATPGFVTYAWSTGETTPNITVGLAGTYSVTVVDLNGCQGSASAVSITIQPTQKPNIQASGPTTFCEGGSVTLDANVTAAAYRWLPSGQTTRTITVTKAGIYSVEVTYANGCKAKSDDIEVQVAPKPVVTVSANGPTTFCEDGEVVLDAGAGHATYKWSNGTTDVGTSRTLRVTTSGNYTCTVANSAGCTATSTPTQVKVNPNPAPTVQASGVTSFCEGDSVTLTASAGFSNYSWSNGGTTRSIVVRLSGQYAVTVKDTNNCTGQSQATTVTVFPTPPKPTITQQQNTLTSSTAAKYQWIKEGSNIANATNQTYDATPTGSGKYRVRIQDQNGCENTSDEINVTTVGVVGDETASALSLFPNPTNGNVTMKLALEQGQGSATVIVRNLIGAELVSLSLDNLTAGENLRSVDLTQLPNGSYYIEVVMPNGQRFTGRITKVD